MTPRPPVPPFTREALGDLAWWVTELADRIDNLETVTNRHGETLGAHLLNGRDENRRVTSQREFARREVERLLTAFRDVANDIKRIIEEDDDDEAPS